MGNVTKRRLRHRIQIHSHQSEFSLPFSVFLFPLVCVVSHEWVNTCWWWRINPYQSQRSIHPGSWLRNLQRLLRPPPQQWHDPITLHRPPSLLFRSTYRQWRLDPIPWSRDYTIWYSFITNKQPTNQPTRAATSSPYKSPAQYPPHPLHIHPTTPIMSIREINSISPHNTRRDSPHPTIPISNPLPQSLILPQSLYPRAFHLLFFWWLPISPPHPWFRHGYPSAILSMPFPSHPFTSPSARCNHTICTAFANHMYELLHQGEWCYVEG